MTNQSLETEDESSVAQIVVYLDLDIVSFNDKEPSWIFKKISEFIVMSERICHHSFESRGKDLFAVFQPSSTSLKPRSIELRQFANSICQSIDNLFKHQHHFRCSTFTGAVISSKEDIRNNFLTVSGKAKRAYHLSRLEVAHTPVFDDAAESTLANQLRAIEVTRLMIANNLVHMRYQPKINQVTGQLLGMEALVRFKPLAGSSNSESLIAPGNILPYIEATEVIHELGAEVLRLVLKDLTYLNLIGMPLVVAINITALELTNEDLPERIRAALASTPSVLPNQLILEVVETKSIIDISISKHILESIAAMGIQIHLDDFGTGFASFSTLKSLPISAIKIDQTFVQNLLTDHRDLSIVKSILDTAKVFNIDVIGEGVENKETGDKLAEMGCFAVQGYYYCRPLVLIDLINWVNELKKTCLPLKTIAA